MGPRNTLCSRSDIVIFSGGLGPTEDDLTREAVAEALGLGLQRDAEIVAALEKRFLEHGWKMSANNTKQADVLEGATILPNPNGTAPGQWLSGEFDGREHIILLLPGPPHEMKGIFENQVRERLQAKIPPAHIFTRTLKIAMLGESTVDARVSPIYKRFPQVETTILAGAGEIELHFKAQAATLEAAEARADEVAGLVEDELEDAVFSRNGESLEQIVSYWLQMRNATVAVAESCTGGLLAERITSDQRELSIFCGRRGCLLQSDENGAGRCSGGDDSSPRGGEPRSSGSAGGRDPLSLRIDPWSGNYGHRRSYGGYGRETGGPGLPRCGERIGHRSNSAKLRRGPQAHSKIRFHHGIGYAEKKADVRRSSE